MERKFFSEIIDEHERKQACERSFMLVNETPHYSITFKSFDHLFDIAELDLKTHHPLGKVFTSRGTNHDNNARIVVLNEGFTPAGELLAFLFDKYRWHNKNNPFVPEFSPSAEKIMVDKISVAGKEAKRLLGKIKPIAMTRLFLKSSFQ